MVKIKKTNEIRIKLGRKKREKETRKERKNKEKRREGGRKQRKERGGERERERHDVAREAPRRNSPASVARFFCGSLMKTVIEYVHYEV